MKFIDNDGRMHDTLMGSVVADIKGFIFNNRIFNPNVTTEHTDFSSYEEDEGDQYDQPQDIIIPDEEKSDDKKSIIIDYEQSQIRLINESGSTIIASDIPQRILNGLSEDLLNIDTSFDTDEEAMNTIIAGIINENEAYLNLSAKSVADTMTADITKDYMKKQLTDLYSNITGSLVSYTATTHPLSSQNEKFMRNMISKAIEYIEEKASSRLKNVNASSENIKEDDSDNDLPAGPEIETHSETVGGIVN